jgi:hypothetical protein
MEPLGTIELVGQSGRRYTYYIYPIGTEFNSVPGNYVFARKESDGYHLIYVGETGDLSARFDNHHKMGCIRRHSATHILVHRSSEDDAVRRAEEDDIIARYSPPCND